VGGHAQQRGLDRHGVLGTKGFDLPGRNHERTVGERAGRNHGQRLHVAAHRRAGVKNVNDRRIGLGHEAGAVVQLQEQRGPAVEFFAHAGRKKPGLRPRYPAGPVRFDGVEAEAAELSVAFARVGRVEGLGLLGRIKADDGVVHDALVAGPKLNGGNVAVGRQVHGQHKHAVQVLAVALVGEGPPHGHHQIGGAQLRAAGEDGHRRRQGRVALGHAAVHPVLDALDFGGAERVFVEVVAVAGVGLPRRHVARAGHVLNGLAVARHLGVGGERKRAHLPHPVAAGAVLVHQRRNVLAERVGRRGLGGGAKRRHHQRSQQKREAVFHKQEVGRRE